jgi:hypothetical protein
LPLPYQQRAQTVGTRFAVRDYIAGMTDHFCLESYDLTVAKGRGS